MEPRYVGIDVSKDRLDVHVLPEETAFAVARDGKGLAELGNRRLIDQPLEVGQKRDCLGVTTAMKNAAKSLT